MAAKVVVVAKKKVSNAPLGEPFQVLTEESAEKVKINSSSRKNMIYGIPGTP